MSDLKIKITHAKNIEELANALDETYVKVSFLGTREVKKEEITSKKKKLRSWLLSIKVNHKKSNAAP